MSDQASMAGVRSAIPSQTIGLPRRVSRRSLLRFLAGAAGGSFLAGLSGDPHLGWAAPPLPERSAVAGEIERVLWERILPAWYPRCLDLDHGGFWESFGEDWTRRPLSAKFLVFQARMTWTAAAVLLAYPERGAGYRRYVEHGSKFLGERMWDAEHGGFLDRTDLAGRPNRQLMPWKQLYSLAFGIYGAAAAYEATRDKAVLQLARDAFRWVDAHAHDGRCGGYFEHVTAEGRPVAEDVIESPPGRGLPLIGLVGHKSMNAHIHMLEALIALRRVWDDPLLAQRLEEVFLIVRDKITMPAGHLALFCRRDFTPVDERSSFGHQLEMAYLLMEAAPLLPQVDHSATRDAARRLVAQALRWGWDDQHGGFYDEGPPAGPPTRRDKVWWVQPEGMNGLLTVEALDGPDAPAYYPAFVRTWRFFCDKMIDPLHGGAYDTVAPDGTPIPDRRHKATPWQAAYHVTRGMLVAIEHLRGTEETPCAS